MQGRSATRPPLLSAQVLCGDFPLIPAMPMSFVDVRDAALVHVAAMTHAHAAGRRFLAVGPSASLDVLGPMLADVFGPLGYPTPRGRMPDTLLRFVACFDKGAAGAFRRLGMRGTRLEPRAARDILGITCSQDHGCRDGPWRRGTRPDARPLARQGALGGAHSGGGGGSRVAGAARRLR